MDLRKKLEQSYNARKDPAFRKVEWQKIPREEQVAAKDRPAADPPAPAKKPGQQKTPVQKNSPQNPPDAVFTDDFPHQSISTPVFRRFDQPRPSLRTIVQEHSSRGYRKAAKLLLLLGRQDGAKILEYFSKEEVEHILTELAGIKKVEDVEAEALLQEFGLIKTTSPVLRGGKDLARDLLHRAFGQEEGETLFRKIIPWEGEKPFQFMFDLDSQQIFILLKNDPMPISAMILAHLPPKTSAGVLKYFNPDARKEYVKRIARLEKVDPAVISSTEELLKERIRTQGKVIVDDIDGRNRLAQILKLMPMAQEEEILKDIEEANPLLYHELKEQIYTADIAFRLNSRDLAGILRDMSNEELAVLMSGQADNFRNLILQNISERRRLILESEMEYMARVPARERERAVRDFTNTILSLRENGEIGFSDEYLTESD